MHRVFCRKNDFSSGRVVLSDPSQFHHIKNVLRFPVGSVLAVCDEERRVFACVIESFSPRGITCLVKHEIKSTDISRCSVTVACAIPKNTRMDDMIDKLTQIGADLIIPLQTERTVVKLDPAKRIARLKRWQKISESASQQSQRDSLPVIAPVSGVRQALKLSAACDLKLVFSLYGARRALKDILIEKSPSHRALILIGPEGDFTPAEVSLAKDHGCIVASLGGSVLRVDTAAIAACAFVKMFYAGNSEI